MTNSEQKNDLVSRAYLRNWPLVIPQQTAWWSRCGGEIGFSSKPGEGSTLWFQISLPVSPEAKQGVDTASEWRTRATVETELSAVTG